jgi:hypothetical protein
MGNMKADAPRPASFEAMRLFLQQAADQLAKDLEQQRLNYPMSGDVLSLLDRVAHVTGMSVWEVWRSWALRHALPVDSLIDKGAVDTWTPDDHRAMAARLRDLLGYCVLGLTICERNDV